MPRARARRAIGERAADLTRKLLAYSGRQIMQPTLGMAAYIFQAVGEERRAAAELVDADVAVVLSELGL